MENKEFNEVNIVREGEILNPGNAFKTHTEVGWTGEGTIQQAKRWIANSNANVYLIVLSTPSFDGGPDPRLCYVANVLYY